MKNIKDKSEMISFQHSLRNMLTWLLNPRTKYLDIDGAHVIRMIVNHLNRSYRFADPSPFKTRTVVKKAKSFDSHIYLAHDPEYLAPLVELYEFVNEKIKPYVTHFFLHGSLATMDYCKGWSDVDTFVVVSKKTLHDTTSLIHFRRECIKAHDYLMRMDPIQHHGFIFATEYDLEYYPSIYMPPPVFDYALTLLDGAEEIIFNVRDTQDETIKGLRDKHKTLARAVETGIFEHHAYNGEYLKGNYCNAENGMYQFKYLMESVMIFPSYFLEALGQSCYKRESFLRCKPFFDPETWKIVEKSTSVRSLWPKHEEHPYHGNAIPLWVQEIIGPNYLEESFRLIDAMMKKLEQKTGLLL